MKKRILALIVSISLALLAGCSSNNAETSAPAETNPAAVSPTVSEASAPATEASSVNTEENAESAGLVMPDTSNLAAYSLPLSDEPVTYSFFVDGAAPFVTPYLGAEQSYNTAEVALYLQKLTGIVIEYKEVPMMTSSEAFSLMVASGDLTDLVSSLSDRYTGGAEAALSEGSIMELTDLISSNMPYYNAFLDANPSYRKMAVNDEGQMLQVCGFNDEGVAISGGCIRQDWLDALGMESPTTVDEMTEVALAMKTKYNSSASIYLTSTLSPSVSLSSAFDLPGFSLGTSGDGFYQVDGKVQYAYVADGMKSMCKTVLSWFKEGLVSTDFYSKTAGLNSKNEILGGQVGMCWDMANSITDYNVNETVAAEGFKLVGMANTILKEGQVSHFAPQVLTTASNIAISSDCENPELILKWLDYGFTSDGILLNNYGMEGYSYELDSNGEPQFLEAMFDRTKGFRACSSTYIHYSAPSIFDVDCTYVGQFDEVGNAAIKLWNSNYDGAYDLPDSMGFTTDESGTFNTTVNDVGTYCSEMLMKFCVGDEDIDTGWDAYVDQVYSLGLQKCIDVKQAAFERYQAR